MSEEVKQVSSGEEAPQESLRDQLSAALAEATTRQEPEAPKEVKPAAEPAATATAGEPTGATAGEEKQAPAHKVPEGWNAEAKAKFKDLPPEVQAAIAKREEDIHKFASKSDEERNFGKSLKQVLTPYEPVIRHLGGDAKAIIADGMQALWVLNTGTADQKAALLGNLAKQYGVNITQLSPQEKQYEDPQIASLKAELARINGTITQQQQLQQTATQAVVNNEIEAFKADPAHPHFEAVRARMGQLMATGQADSLQDAYDQACWSNPEIRSALIADQARQQEETRKKELQAKQQQKRNAASSVTGSPSNGRLAAAADDGLSLRDELRRNLQASTGRI